MGNAEYMGTYSSTEASTRQCPNKHVRMAEKKATGLQAPLDVSPELAKIIGTDKGEQVSRPQVVKKLWAYLKDKNLQDPETKQPIFGKEKIKCFSMSKYLKEHLTNPNK